MNQKTSYTPLSNGDKFLDMVNFIFFKKKDNPLQFNKIINNENGYIGEKDIDTDKMSIQDNENILTFDHLTRRGVGIKINNADYDIYTPDQNKRSQLAITPCITKDDLIIMLKCLITASKFFKSSQYDEGTILDVMCSVFNVALPANLNSSTKCSNPSSILSNTAPREEPSFKENKKSVTEGANYSSSSKTEALPSNEVLDSQYLWTLKTELESNINNTYHLYPSQSQIYESIKHHVEKEPSFIKKEKSVTDGDNHSASEIKESAPIKKGENDNHSSSSKNKSSHMEKGSVIEGANYSSSSKTEALPSNEVLDRKYLLNGKFFMEMLDFVLIQGGQGIGNKIIKDENGCRGELSVDTNISIQNNKDIVSFDHIVPTGVDIKINNVNYKIYTPNIFDRSQLAITPFITEADLKIMLKCLITASKFFKSSQYDEGTIWDVMCSVFDVEPANLNPSTECNNSSSILSNEVADRQYLLKGKIFMKMLDFVLIQGDRGIGKKIIKDKNGCRGEWSFDTNISIQDGKDILTFDHIEPTGVDIKINNADYTIYTPDHNKKNQFAITPCITEADLKIMKKCLITAGEFLDPSRYNKSMIGDIMYDVFHTNLNPSTECNNPSSILSNTVLDSQPLWPPQTEPESNINNTYNLYPSQSQIYESIKHHVEKEPSFIKKYCAKNIKHERKEKKNTGCYLQFY